MPSQRLLPWATLSNLDAVHHLSDAGGGPTDALGDIALPAGAHLLAQDDLAPDGGNQSLRRPQSGLVHEEGFDVASDIAALRGTAIILGPPHHG